jgi:hypothetical protein
VRAVRVLGSAAAAAGIVLLLAGCGSLAVQPTATPSITLAPTAAPSASPSGTPTPPPDAVIATPAPSRTGAAAAGAPADQCPDSDLGVAVAPADGGGTAGSLHRNVLVTNTGGEACALRGTPAVSVVGGADGPRIGPSADRRTADARTVELQPGQTVAAPLQVVDIGTDGGPLDGCTVRKGAGYRVVVPHGATAFFVEDPTAVACATGPDFMTVGPLVRFTD